MQFALMITSAIALGAVAEESVSSPNDATRVQIRVSDRPGLQGRNSHYMGNRAPLMATPLIKLPIGDIDLPERTWLRVQIRGLRDGLVGNLSTLSKYCGSDSGWLDPSKPGAVEAAYWLRAYGDMGFVLDDERITTEIGAWLDAIIEGQQEDGYFGPIANKTNHNYWPNMIVLQAMRSRFEGAGDKRVTQFMTKYFRYRATLSDEQLLVDDKRNPTSTTRRWAYLHASEELASIYWLYNQTGEKWLVDLGDRMGQLSADWSGAWPSKNGIDVAQGIKQPAVQYERTGDASLLASVSRKVDALFTEYGRLPGGVPSLSDKRILDDYTGPRHATQTHSVVEMMHSFEQLLRITGNAVYADRCEVAALNALPATVSPDLRSVRRVVAPNVIKAGRMDALAESDLPDDMFAVAPEKFPYATHNVGFGWTGFAQHLWMATPGNGLAALFYAPCTVSATVGKGITVTITEATDYPFDETIKLTINTPSEVRFPLTLRIPKWCDSPTLTVNGVNEPITASTGKYVVLDKRWRDGDTVTLSLVMKVRLERHLDFGNAVTVQRGPFFYSLQIQEHWERVGSKEWPHYVVTPRTPWNYALVLPKENPVSAFTYTKREGTHFNQPFHSTSAPCKLMVQGQLVADWKAGSHDTVEPIPVSPVPLDEESLEDLQLIPMGCTRLVMTTFPTVVAPTQARKSPTDARE